MRACICRHALVRAEALRGYLGEILLRTEFYIDNPSLDGLDEMKKKPCSNARANNKQPHIHAQRERERERERDKEAGRNTLLCIVHFIVTPSIEKQKNKYRLGS